MQQRMSRRLTLEAHAREVEEHLRTRKVRPALASVPGSPPSEQWRMLSDLPEVLVSSEGRVRSLLNGKLLKASKVSDGYTAVTVRRLDGWSKPFLVHRLVALAFLGPAPTEGMVVAHCNGIPNDNRAINLRWATAASNSLDTLLHRQERRLEGVLVVKPLGRPAKVSGVVEKLKLALGDVVPKDVRRLKRLVPEVAGEGRKTLWRALKELKAMRLAA
jgi:hypothetical protein